MKTQEFDCGHLTDLLNEIQVYLENTESHGKVLSIAITPKGKDGFLGSVTTKN